MTQILMRGVDVASFQGQPASWQAEAGDITWAAVKITELQPSGLRYVNPDAAADWEWLKAHGKIRVAYLFGHPGTSVAATVEFFIATIRGLGLDDADGIGLDLETTDGRTPAEVDAWALAVLAALETQLGRTPVLYTFLSFAQERNTALLGRYPLWMSDPSSPAGQPRIPAPWTSWLLHQYSTGGTIDRDVARFTDAADLRAALGARTKPDPIPPAPARQVIQEDPMLLKTGEGAVTPVVIPAPATAVRFFAAGPAALDVQFHGHTATTVKLDRAGGSKRIEAPKGCHAVTVIRADTGTVDVAVAVE